MRRTLILTGSALLLAQALISLVRAEDTATVTTGDLVTFTRGSSQMKRPIPPDEVFLVISKTGDDEITLEDHHGFQAFVPKSEVHLIASAPVAAATPSVPATNSVPVVPPPPASPAIVSSTSSAPAISPADTDMMQKLNAALELPLFANANLWADNVDDVASRLKWPQESKTTVDASYRKYAIGKGLEVLGARAYSMALYGRGGHPSYLSVVFANKGDFEETRALMKKRMTGGMPTDDEIQKATSDLNAVVKKDADTIEAQLTALLGPPESHVYGVAADSREDVHRWNWNGHAIMLSSPRGEYAAVKIIPADVADHFGDVANMDRDAIKTAIASRVLKRDNGDVVIQDIPMVDQGPKGYCVPATWERYLRYVDVPADMYVLAMLGNTGLGGGTSLAAIRGGVDGYVEAYGRRIDATDVPLDASHISKFIDQGLPLMWGCFVIDNIEKKINAHTKERRTVTDWSAYTDRLAQEDKGLQPLTPEDTRMRGHMRLIIGYNAATNELAISDSWGSNFTERWISVKEAQNISQNDLEFVRW